LTLSAKRLRQFLSKLSTDRLQLLKEQTEASLGRCEKQFPGYGWERLAEAFTPKPFGLSGFLSRRKGRSEEYVAIRQRENLLHEINLRLLQRDDFEPPVEKAPATSEASEVSKSKSPAHPDSDATDRRRTVDAFLLTCKEETALKAIRAHIWRAADHRSGRQFQYWQACDQKATAQDDQNFRRILAMKPTDFEALLRKKHII
jgi:hypothetical protein